LPQAACLTALISVGARGAPLACLCSRCPQPLARHRLPVLQLDFLAFLELRRQLGPVPDKENSEPATAGSPGSARAPQPRTAAPLSATSSRAASGASSAASEALLAAAAERLARSAGIGEAHKAMAHLQALRGLRDNRITGSLAAALALAPTDEVGLEGGGMCPGH
jgi:hypothetical protein